MRRLEAKLTIGEIKESIGQVAKLIDYNQLLNAPTSGYDFQVKERCTKLEKTMNFKIKA